MNCGRCIELDTPQTIKDEGNRYYEADTDIFSEVFDVSGLTLSNRTIMIQALWWKWRDYCIASCKTPEWVRGMADRLGLVGRKWDEIITKAYADDVDLTSLDDRSYERIVQRTAIPDTDGDVRVITREGTDTNVNSKTGEDTQVTSQEGDDTQLTEHEALPQTSTDSTKYLDSRQTVTTTPGVETTVTTTPGVETTDELTHNTTDTETYAPSTQDKETYVADDSLTAVTFSDMLNNYPNVLLGFVEEFDGYFIDRWYL